MFQMLSTQRVSAPMLPVDVCLDILKRLPVNEVQLILNTILTMLDKDDHVSLLTQVMIKYMALGGPLHLDDFISDAFSSSLLGLLDRLREEEMENVVSQLVNWMLPGDLLEAWKSLNAAMTGSECMEKKEQEVQCDLGETEANTAAKKPLVRKKRGKYKKRTWMNLPVKRAAPVKKAENEQQEIKLAENIQEDDMMAQALTGGDAITDDLANIESAAEDREDGAAAEDGLFRRSRRRNKGKNPRFQAEKLSDDELGDVVIAEEDSGEEWKHDGPERDDSETTPHLPNNAAFTVARKANRMKKVKQIPPDFECNICELKSKNYLDYKKHMSIHESEDWPRCDVCKRVRLFKTEELLQAHKKEKHGPFICNICGKEFSAKASLEKHGVVHGETYRYKCEQCQKGFSSIHSLTVHENVHHKGIKPFLCTICGNGFTSKISLVEHMNMHNGIKPFSCKICDLSFARKSTLRLHNISEHNENTMNVKCKICHKTYKNIYVLKAHMKLHDNPKDKPTKERPTCEICGRQFKGKAELEKHVKIVHLKIKEFKCEVCGKLFSTRVHMREHLATHTREAQFFCEICGEGFIHRVTYKVHVFKHQGEKLCVCPICDKKFDVPRFLTRHIQQVHKHQHIPELPKYEIPRSRLAKYLRQPRKNAKNPEPPAVAPMGSEKMRAKKEEVQLQITIGNPEQYTQQQQHDLVEQIEVLDSDLVHDLNEEEVKNLPVIDATGLDGNNIVEIFDELATELKTEEEEAYEVENQAMHVIDMNEAQQFLAEGGAQILTAELPAEEAVNEYEETEPMKMIELEIDGQRQMIQVPSNAEFLQVGENILKFQ